MDAQKGTPRGKYLQMGQLLCFLPGPGWPREVIVYTPDKARRVIGQIHNKPFGCYRYRAYDPHKGHATREVGCIWRGAYHDMVQAVSKLLEEADSLLRCPPKRPGRRRHRRTRQDAC